MLRRARTGQEDNRQWRFDEIVRQAGIRAERWVVVQILPPLVVPPAYIHEFFARLRLGEFVIAIVFGELTDQFEMLSQFHDETLSRCFAFGCGLNNHSSTPSEFLLLRHPTASNRATIASCASCARQSIRTKQCRPSSKSHVHRNDTNSTAAAVASANRGHVVPPTCQNPPPTAS